MIWEVCCWDGLWTLCFGLSQFHGHGSWLVCEVALIYSEQESVARWRHRVLLTSLNWPSSWISGSPALRKPQTPALSQNPSILRHRCLLCTNLILRHALILRFNSFSATTAQPCSRSKWMISPLIWIAHGNPSFVSRALFLGLRGCNWAVVEFQVHLRGGNWSESSEGLCSTKNSAKYCRWGEFLGLIVTLYPARC